MTADGSLQAPPRLEVVNGRATITLSAPAAHNRITPSDLEVLAQHLDELEYAAQTRVVVLTGSGEKTFCSGYDASSLNAGLDKRWEALLDRLESFATPTICAMNGSIYGGGVDLALCCDIRIGVTGSKMSMPTARLGINLYPGGMQRFVRHLGTATTKRLLLTGLPIDAQEMARIGFLCELTDRANLADAVQKYADAIIQCEPRVLATTKRFLNMPHWRSDTLAAMRDAHEQSIAASAASGRLAGWKNKDGNSK